VSFDLELAGRRALVTAGTKGVGAAAIKALTEAGVKVVAVARTVPDSSPEGIHYIASDITAADGCGTVAEGVLDRLGGIDIIVNVLGGSSAPPGGFAALSDEEWSQDLNINLMLAVRLDISSSRWGELTRDGFQCRWCAKDERSVALVAWLEAIWSERGVISATHAFFGKAFQMARLGSEEADELFRST
jgi:NAD(P)-dependent dehydrogenase (short-subunit alcohol dehydrogenase family)